MPLFVGSDLKKEITNNFKQLLGYKKRGINLFFPDIDKLKQMMLDELKEDLN